MPLMANPKKPRKASAQTSTLGIKIDPELRSKVDAWIARYNGEHDHRATLTSVVEAALRRYISEVDDKQN